MNYQEALDHLYLRTSDREYWAKYGDDEKARDTLQELIDNQSDYQSFKDIKAEYEEELRLTRKALLICASKLGYEENKCEHCEWSGFYEEPETQEEAQSRSIHNQYTRPKKIASKMLEIVKTDRYKLQTDITLKFWDSEMEKAKKW